MQDLRKISPPSIITCINGVEFNCKSGDLVLIDESGKRTFPGNDFDFSERKILEIIKKEVGFATVIAGESRVVIAADRVRVYPLYYSVQGSRLLVSDDASWIRSLINNPIIERKSEIEFYQAGFVAGPRTLYQNISTLQAGEYICANFKVDRWLITKKRHFTYFPQEITARPSDELEAELDKILLNIFTNLRERHSDKTLIVPLSGGFDSRLIVHWLKRLGCENVFCYTFGTPENPDCIKAREIAGRLGYPIKFVHLTRKLWRQSYSSNLYQEFKNRYAGYCTVMSNQEFPAFYYMIKNKIIPEDAVILPGHTGDFISGGHIPRNIYNYSANIESVIKYVFQKHFTLWKTINLPYRKKDMDYILKKIRHQLDRFAFNSHEDVASGIEYYDWQERQGKFIVQFVCVYRLFDRQFELPLWSNRLLDFFLKIPLELKLNRKLYRGYLHRYDKFCIFTDSYHQVDSTIKVSRLHTKLSKIKRVVYNDLFYKQFVAFFKDDLNFFSPFSYSRLVLSLGMYRNPNSFFVQDYLKELKSGIL